MQWFGIKDPSIDLLSCAICKHNEHNYYVFPLMLVHHANLIVATVSIAIITVVASPPAFSTTNSAVAGTTIIINQHADICTLPSHSLKSIESIIILTNSPNK